MGRIFGTDGARGIAISELTCEMAMNIGKAAALILTETTTLKPKILIGKDTRISCDVLEAALIAGICSVGADVHLLGVVPTPAVAYLVRKYKADAGVMISASHNSAEFNGIKLFSSEGFKLPDDIEERIENLILDYPEDMKVCDGSYIGRVYNEKNAVWDYVRHIMKASDGYRGIKVAIDCANGAASETAVKLFQGLGATCFFINNEPNGININKDCGSTHLEALQDAVKRHKCDIGLAFDGDADRCLAVDENGEVLDGDKMLAIFSAYLKNEGKLSHNTCVVTVMTNLGFFRFAKDNGVIVSTTTVGDRYVLENMQQHGYNLGGEQSGHVIFSDYATTGDGELTGVMLLNVLSKTGKKLSELSKIMHKYPQVLVNVKIKSQWKNKWQEEQAIMDEIQNYKDKLGDEGRVLVRESGTEPLVRVMIEGKQYGVVLQYANAIAKVIRERCGETE